MRGLVRGIRRLVPALVVLAVCGGLFLVGREVLREITLAFSHDPRVNIKSNMLMLQRATAQMAQDGIVEGDPSLGWPGDTGGTFAGWARELVSRGYVSTNDFCRLMSAPGFVVRPPDRLPEMKECGVLVYAVSTNSPQNAVFLSSANFTNTATGGLPLNTESPMFRKVSLTHDYRGFVVVRKDGTASILPPEKVGDPNAIGAYEPLCR